MMKNKFGLSVGPFSQIVLLGLSFTWFFVSCITSLEDLSQEEIACLETNCIDQYYPECNVDNENFKRISRSECIAKALERKDSLQTLEATFASYEPKGSQPSGFKANPFYLSIDFPDSTAKLYYTTDNSAPSQNSSIFPDSLLISETLVIRIKAVSTQGFSSKETILSYVLDITYSDSLYFSPLPGEYSKPFYLKVGSKGSSQGEIRYSFSQPVLDNQSPILKDSVLINKNTRIVVRKIDNGRPVTRTYQAIYNFKTPPPTSSLTPNSYSIKDSVYLFPDSLGDQIFYTLNGEIPTSLSSIYNRNPFILDKNLYIRAFSQRKDWLPSEVVSFRYSFTAQGSVPKPFADVDSGLQPTPVSVGFSNWSDSLRIFYTLDPTLDPDSNSTEYTKPIYIEKNTVLRAIAYQKEKPSSIAEYSYRIRTPKPTLTPDTGLFVDFVEVNIDGGDGETEYFYSFHPPSDKSGPILKYTGKVKIYSTDTLYAYALKPGMAPSLTVQGIYNIQENGVTNPPTFSELPGKNTPISLTLSTSTPNAKIYYSVVGLGSDTSFKLYNKEIAISENQEIRAYAEAPNLKPSKVIPHKYLVKVEKIEPSESDSVVPQKFWLKLKSPTVGAEVRYSSSNDVNANSPRFPDSLFVNDQVKIYARAFKTNMEPSDQGEFTYRVIKQDTVEPVIPNKIGAQYEDFVKVVLSTKTQNATIYYAYNDNDLNLQSSKFTDTLVIQKSTKLRAMAVKNGLVNSPIMEQNYIIKTGPPIFTKVSPNEKGNYLDTVVVSFENSGADAVIYYQVGAQVDLTKSPSVYKGPFTLDTTATVYAIRQVAGKDPSKSIYQTFNIESRDPVISPAGGEFGNVQPVTMSHPRRATIYYTDDDKDPTTSSKVYSSPLNLTTSTTIKAIAVRTGTKNSDIVKHKFDYVPSGAWDKPTFSKSEGDYWQPQDLKIDYPSQANCRYTDNGNDPNTSSNPCPIGAIKISRNTTIKAYVYGQGKTDSKIAYVRIEIHSAKPLIEPSSQSYNNQIDVKITHPTTDVKIYYTTDGQNPSPSQNQYTKLYTPNQKLTFNSTTQLKAIAIETDMLPSGIDSAKFTKNPTPQWDAPKLFTSQAIFQGSGNVSIQSPPGSKCAYATNEDPLTPSSAPCPTGPFTITEITTVKAIAYGNPYLTSEIAQKTYRVQVLPPIIDNTQRDFKNSIQVSLSHTDPKAKIYYDLSNSKGLKKGILYTGQFKLEETTTLYAYAKKPNTDSSRVISDEFKRTDIKGPNSKTSSLPVNGAYLAPFSVQIEFENGLTCFYTDNGADPFSSAANPCPLSPIPIDNTKTIKAYTKNTNGVVSDLMEEKFTIWPPSLTIDPGSSSFSNFVKVSLKKNATNSNAQIIYSTSGEPTESNYTPYNTEISLTNTASIWARAFEPNNDFGFRLGPVVFGNYTKQVQQFGKPSISISGRFFGGAYDEPPEVSISNQIAPSCFYIINDEDPRNKGSTCPTNSFLINSSSTIRAINFGTGGSNSEVAEANILIRPPQIQFNNSSPSFKDRTSVSLARKFSQPNSEIWYTTNGEEPTAQNRKLYIGEFVIDEDMVIMARGFQPNNPGGYQLSSISQMSFKKQYLHIQMGRSPEPNGAYKKPLKPTIYWRPGWECKYTLDDTDPKTNGSACPPNAFNVQTSGTIRVYSYDPKSNLSEQLEQSFTVLPGKVSILSPTDIYSDILSVELTRDSLGPSEEIIYTINGKEPTEEDHLKFSSSVQVFPNTILSVRAYNPTNKIGNQLGEITSQVWEQMSPPEFSLEDNTTYEPGVVIDIQLAKGEEGLCTYSTGKNNSPTIHSRKCEPIELKKSRVLNAKVFGKGKFPSILVSKRFRIKNDNSGDEDDDESDSVFPAISGFFK